MCTIFIHEFSDSTQQVNKKSYISIFYEVICLLNIDTEIVEKPIFVNLTCIFREPIKLQCMHVRLKHQFLFQNQIFNELTQEIKSQFILSQLL